MLKKTLKLIFPKFIITALAKLVRGNSPGLYINHDIVRSYAQYQEDLIISSFFNGKHKGTFIDIGAYDPNELSNTKKFYDQGWRGVNVDPNESTIRAFEEQRSEDLNINCGISSSFEDLLFYELNYKSLSTFNHEDAVQSLSTIPDASIIREYKVHCIPLSNVFEQFNQKVDFLSIDVEGYEETVLKSNNWDLYRPTLIVIEINRNTDNLLNFLREIGYEKIFDNNTNGIFVDKKN